MLPRRLAVTTDDKNRLRQYLLGELSDADEAQVEVRLLSDEAYFEELEMVESELMDEYVQDKVSEDERAKLESRLLRNKHQQQKLAFAGTLDAESEARAAAKAKVVPLVVRARKAAFSPYLKTAAGVIVAVGLLFGLWLLLGRKSDVERGMIALNQAQGNERLIQSRISQLNYAEVRSFRGNQTGLQDSEARNYSERLLLDAVHQKQDAASYHALGRLYLAERNFARAREQFEKALQKDPNDPQLQSDMGATLLELGQTSDDGQRPRYLAESLQYLDRALELNSSLPEAFFNRALVYQAMPLLPQAKEAWRRYLQTDSTSPWAREAERNLKTLEEQEQKGQSKRADLQQSYLAAYHAKDREAAWTALKQSRSRAAVLNQEILSYATNLAHHDDAAAANYSAVNLYRILIQPVEQYIGAADELCIVPDKTLSSLPFGALRSPETGKFLIEEHCVIVSPSVNVFMECTREAVRKQHAGSESVLSVGNPDFSRPSFPNLADLPAAAREAEQVAASYKSQPLLGPKANELQVRARMSQADVIHFAAHYVVDPQSPMKSALLLSQAGSRAHASHQDDGLLQAYEIYSMKLPRTRLAVLSACQTGLERSYQGEGLELLVLLFPLRSRLWLRVCGRSIRI